MKEASIEIVKKLKYYTMNFYKLAPVELGEYLKLKGNLHVRGITLSADEIQNTSEEKLAQHIESANDGEVTPLTLEKLLTVDVEAIEEERVAIRKQLFEHDVKIRIAPTGGAFSVQWNKKLNTCRIHIPSSWTIEIDHSLLISLYDRDLSRTTINTVSQNMNGLVLQLFRELQDFALVKSELQKENQRVDMTPVLLSVLQNSVEKGDVAFGQVLEWIGLHRRRLITKFTALQNSECTVM